MASCFACFRPFREQDNLREERLKALKELEDIQAGVGNFPPEGDLQTPDIAAKLTTKVEKGKADADDQSSPEMISSEDGDMTTQQQAVDPSEDAATAMATAAAIIDPTTCSPPAARGDVTAHSDARAGTEADPDMNTTTISGAAAGERLPAKAVDECSTAGGGGEAAASTSGVCSPSCTTTAATASSSGCTSLTCGGGGGTAAAAADPAADPERSSPSTPAPSTAAKSRSPPSSSRQGLTSGTPWYPPGPNVVLKPLPPSPTRISTSGKALILAGFGLSPDEAAAAAAAAAARRSQAPSPGSSGNYSGGAKQRHGSGSGSGSRGVVGSRYTRMYGGSVGLPVSRASPPPPPGVFTSASTRLALHDVLHHRSRGVVGGGGGGRVGHSISALGHMDFRPRWRY